MKHYVIRLHPGGEAICHHEDDDKDQAEQYVRNVRSDYGGKFIICQGAQRRNVLLKQPNKASGLERRGW
jgi:predicted SpoU family rRNA methylase